MNFCRPRTPMEINKHLDHAWLGLHRLPQSIDMQSLQAVIHVFGLAHELRLSCTGKFSEAWVNLKCRKKTKEVYRCVVSADHWNIFDDKGCYCLARLLVTRLHFSNFKFILSQFSLIENSTLQGISAFTKCSPPLSTKGWPTIHGTDDQISTHDSRI